MVPGTALPTFQGTPLVQANLSELPGDPSASKVKLATVLDQSSDAEVKVIGVLELRAMLGAWKAEHNDGEEPTEDQEATGEQISGLAHRLRQGATPFVDFGVWRPHGADLGRTLKFAAWFLNPSGQWAMKEIVGPSSFEEWSRSWAVFAFAMELLGAASRTRLEKYAKTIAALNRDYPSMWWAICMADIKMRRAHLERVRRRLTSEHHELTTAGLRSDFDPAMPWDAVFREAARDRDFWDKEVDKKVVQFATHQRTKDELSDQGFGSIKFAQQPGAASAPSGSGDGTQARKRRGAQSGGGAQKRPDNRPPPPPQGGKGGKGGKGNNKGKDANKKVNGKYAMDANGRQLCWAWNRAPDGCQAVCPQGRIHLCEICRGADPPEGHRTCGHRG